MSAISPKFQGDVHREAVRSGRNKSYAVGCINPTVGNLTALCASAVIPGRLALTSYIIAYAFVHDDSKRPISLNLLKRLTEVYSHYGKANNKLTEGLNGNKDVRLSQNDMRRQLKDKMSQGLLKIDKGQGHKILRLWKEMSNVFIEIGDLNF